MQSSSEEEDAQVDSQTNQNVIDVKAKKETRKRDKKIKFEEDDEPAQEIHGSDGHEKAAKKIVQKRPSRSSRTKVDAITVEAAQSEDTIGRGNRFEVKGSSQKLKHSESQQSHRSKRSEHEKRQKLQEVQHSEDEQNVANPNSRDSQHRSRRIEEDSYKKELDVHRKQKESRTRRDHASQSKQERSLSKSKEGRMQEQDKSSRQDKSRRREDATRDSRHEKEARVAHQRAEKNERSKRGEIYMEDTKRALSHSSSDDDTSAQRAGKVDGRRKLRESSDMHQRTDKEASEDVKRKTFQTSEDATYKREIKDNKDSKEHKVSKRRTKTKVTDTVNESGSDEEKKKKQDKRRKTEQLSRFRVPSRHVTGELEDIGSLANLTGSNFTNSGTGSRIAQMRGNRQLLQQLQDKIDACLTKEEYNKVHSEVPRMLAEMGIYKEKMKVFEQQFSIQNNEAALNSKIDEIKQKIATAFTGYKETKSRIQRLNESEIMNLKNIMCDLAAQVHEITRRLAENDAEKLKIQHSRLPKDLYYLSKDEMTLRRELALSLEDSQDMKDTLNTELKRLRREHYTNLKDLEQIVVKCDMQANQLNNVVERQGLNDQAMAAIFKIMKLDYSLLAQDEDDRQSVYLMGKMPDSSQPVKTRTHQIQVLTSASPSIDQDEPSHARVIALNRNCLTHSDAQHNETVMKAFKMACLNYQPSAVEFEHNMYRRIDLIRAKGDLLSYCLGQLKHLDLSLLDHQMHVAALNNKRLDSQPEQDRDLSMFDPKDFPPISSSMVQSRSREVDWLQQDSVQSAQTGRRGKDFSQGHSLKKSSLINGLHTVRLSMPNPVKDCHQASIFTTAQSSREAIHPRTKQLASPPAHQLATISGNYKDDNQRLDVRCHDTSSERLDNLSIDGTGIQPYDAQRLSLYTAHKRNNQTRTSYQTTLRNDIDKIRVTSPNQLPEVNTSRDSRKASLKKPTGAENALKFKQTKMVSICQNQT